MVETDLFTAATVSPEGTVAAGVSAPLAVRIRPQTLAEVIGQDDLKQPGSALRRLIDGETGAASVILFGPPGTGKTTLAYIAAAASGRHFAEVSAVMDGVKEVRAVIAGARTRLARGQETILFIDEVHRFSKSQQDALLPAVENGWVRLIAATTENPVFSIVSPLLSRSLLVRLTHLDAEHSARVIERALTHPQGLAGYTITDRAKEALIRLGGGDARRILTLLEAGAGAASGTEIRAEDIGQAANSATIHYDQDQHYDVTSAFIKSMRGSDPDAAVHYLARMLEAGEDVRFIARRIMICAAEDVGLADPQILPLTVAAAQAVALVGMPEARIILSEAVIAVACAPKSPAAYRAIDTAIGDIRAGRAGAVPPHLRDTHYAGAELVGASGEYRYAHDYPHGVAPQEYLPETLRGTQYYQPTDHGHEALLQSRLEKIAQLRQMG